MKNNIGILGGDLRIVFLGKILAKDGYKVYTYGIENYNFFNDNIIKCQTIDEVSKNCKNIISGIPFSKDDTYINTVFSNKKIEIEYVLKKLENKTLVAGAITRKIKDRAYQNKINLIDLMENESFTIMNVIPTVEGAIQIAMENTEFTINNSNCLVLGFGRIGKLLSKQLYNLGANVICMARKDKDLAWIKASGYKGIHINDLSENLNKCDIIFNTVPSIILNDKRLKILKNNNANVMIIELASKPGGIDLEKAKEYNIKTISAQGLPGKVAPATSAKYIKESLDKILN